MTIVGLISDTHGLLRTEAAKALTGVDQIVHAGDVGAPEILDQLRKIAPLTAVRGNVDAGNWASSLPVDAVLSVEGYEIYVLHILSEIEIDPNAAAMTAVISGHTHKPLIETKSGVLYINPGSAGPRRFSLPVSLGFLRLEEDKPPEAWIQTLDI
ncbi:MAG: metallophosphoesterase family protein [Rhodomicrobium sp.]